MAGKYDAGPRADRRLLRLRTGGTARGLRRWLVFNAVGTMGVAVQLAALVSLTELAGLNYLLATALAVESAILHNFVWHERWTWRDRGPGAGGRWARLARFNLLTGAVSIGANVVFTGLYASVLGVHYALANLLAIASCSLLNFLANDRLVFRAAPGAERTENRRRREGEVKVHRTPPRARPPRPSAAPAAVRAAAAAALLAGTAAGAPAAELQPQTVAAWDRYVEATEQRIAAELEDPGRFLAQDFRADAAEARREVLAGRVRIDKLETRGPGGERIRIPKGAVHHWLGSALVPGVTLEELLHALIHAVEPEDLQDDVIESRVLSRPGKDRLEVFLKLRRKQMVTVHYNTEHAVAYVRHRPGAASSRSVATRIAELEDAGSADEREKPIGRDRGFLWRLNSYWRYRQVDEGVIVECESVSLSRGVPRLLRWMASPLINRAARDILSRTLESMAEVLGARAPAAG